MADDEQVIGGEWVALPLRCQLSHMRLTDPARCEDCRHISGCNYDELCEAGNGRKSTCPIVGCDAVLRKRRLVCATRRCGSRHRMVHRRRRCMALNR